MKTTFTRLISIFLACIILLSAFGGTFAFAYEENSEEIIEVAQSVPKNGWNDDKTMYYVDDVAVTGFYDIDGNRYYFDETTAIKVTGFQTIDSNSYLFASTGEMLYGFQKYDGGTYYFDASQDGKMVTGLKKISGSYYYFSDSGRRVTGWKKINGSTYYFDVNSGKAAKGLKKIGGAYYFFNDNAKRVTGWKKINNGYYFFDKTTGKAAKGFKAIGGDYYYFNKNARRIKGWKNVGNSRYFFGVTSGKGAKGFKKIYGSYYYFNSNARMQTGWKTINGYKYYFNPQKGANYGKAVTTSIKINGQTYNFAKNGRYISSAATMLKKANALSSRTGYLVLVNKSTHKVGIFTGKKGNWKMIKYYTCTIGAPATPTPTGTFTLGPSRGMPYHQLYFDSGWVRCWYASRIIGGYNFHSVLYTQASRPVAISDPRLGYNLSHGCIRLHINNAKWFYNHVPSGTKCVIYNR